MTFQEEIGNFREKNFEPFINAVKFIEILSFAFNVTNAEAVNVIKKKCKEIDKNLTAIAIQDNNDYGFIDKQKSIKVFNSFSTTYGFDFSLIDTIAFLDNVSVDDIFVSVNDLKSLYPVLTEILPKERCIFVDKELFCSMHDLNSEHKSIEKYLKFTELQEEKAKNTLLQTENERLKAENAELKAQLQDNAQRQSAVDSEPVLGNGKVTRISKIQRDIFTLLILKNYQGMESRNALFDVINADLKEQGINNKGASYQTFDNLIDETIRLTKIGLDGKQISHSPFPSKITK